ncbi:MAG: hypothetical protein LBL34_03645 [Clostridiales bacterium]|nr:hypothetical protein [Clostridiales bacterium]
MIVFAANGDGNNGERLIKKYKHLVKPSGKKTPEEMADFLEDKLSAVPIDFSSFVDVTRKVTMLHLNLYIKTKGMDLSFNDLEFMAYKIPNDKFGAEYYKYPYKSMEVEGHGDDLIYVILEKHLDNYINCNCGKLSLDLAIKRGVSDYDYENNTIGLLEYLSRLEAIENKWY